MQSNWHPVFQPSSYFYMGWRYNPGEGGAQGTYTFNNRMKEYKLGDMNGLPLKNDKENCVYINSNVGKAHIFNSYDCKEKAGGRDIKGICLYTECTAVNGKTCIFPFK